MTQTEKGAPLWKLKAPEAALTPQGAARLSSPEIEFHKAGRLSSTARAREAYVRGGSRDVLLDGDVVIVSAEEKSTLRTPKLEYRADKALFHTEAEVVIERPGAVVRGRGLEADSSLSMIRIFKQETSLR